MAILRARSLNAGIRLSVQGRHTRYEEDGTRLPRTGRTGNVFGFEAFDHGGFSFGCR